MDHQPPETSRPFLIVCNASSGAAGAEDSLQVVQQVLTAAGRKVELLPLCHSQPAPGAPPQRPDRRGGASALDATLQAAVSRARACGGVLVVAGGDGTVSAAVRQVLPAGVPLGIIPGGTFNYFARSHGIPVTPEAAAAALLTARVQPVAVAEVNGRPFTVNASFGLYAQSLVDREAFKQRLGRSRLVAWLAGLATLLRAPEQWRLMLSVDGQPCRQRLATLFVGNNALQLEQTGVPGVAALEAGALVAIVVHPARLRERLAIVLRGAAGHLAAAEQVECFAFRELEVRPQAPGRGRRLRVGIDGETLWLAPPLRFGRASRPLQLLVPAVDGQGPACA